MSADLDGQDDRITMIVGDEEDPAKASALWLAHLRRVLHLPCDVVGIEDFRWEEPYLLGIGDAREYQRLCRRQPSYSDLFSLEGIEPEADSEWPLRRDDLGARVRRKKDSREFLLGLSELKPADEDSENFQPLHDYAVWFANYT